MFSPITRSSTGQLNTEKPNYNCKFHLNKIFNTALSNRIKKKIVSKFLKFYTKYPIFNYIKNFKIFKIL